MFTRPARLLPLLLLLAGCAVPPGLYVERPGTVFRLEKPIVIPANTAHLTFQNGRAIREAGPLQGADFYYPHCWLDIGEVAPRPRTVAPGDYRLIRVRDDSELFSAPATVLFRTDFTLRNARGRRLTLVCAQLDDAWEFDYVTRAQMQRALGAFITIHPPSDSETGRENGG